MIPTRTHTRARSPNLLLKLPLERGDPVRNGRQAEVRRGLAEEPRGGHGEDVEVGVQRVCRCGRERGRRWLRRPLSRTGPATPVQGIGSAVLVAFRLLAGVCFYTFFDSLSASRSKRGRAGGRDQGKERRAREANEAPSQRCGFEGVCTPWCRYSPGGVFFFNHVAVRFLQYCQDTRLAEVPLFPSIRL